MTSKIPFSDVIETVNEFLESHPDCFPLILSLENHCTVPFQEIMAKNLIEIFGERLYVPDEQILNGILPSPIQ